ncbi:MAG: AbrB/MazE/SpoVT family DNA-binding domain-containing protein [Thermoplasmatales archaeon]|jgi:AbrB family looped-hinge helix DNA binding protein|nr:AbrB/MazE/SpoVT family DNA-binding domain-containing protein [Candidatus Thermoplasmatota archaeon]MDA8055547.1 AbrB/MazE/SpoVT family DNA-binding domain-containing protein [Thermoplasmatales archaeon]
MTKLSKVTGKGQVTIPVEFRLDLGVKAGDKVLFEKKNGSIIIRKAEKKGTVEVLEDSTPFSKSAKRMMKKIRDEWD